MKKIFNLFRFRLRIVQKAYDNGWEHGYEAGMVEQKNQIIDLLSSHIENIDWLRETPIEIREIIPIVKSHQEDKELVGWEE